ncbi:MAG: hypothetical protein U0R51_02740 [Solirubrobacterales bacterium]
MSTARTSMLLGAAIAAALLLLPGAAGASSRPAPPSAAAFERATRELIRSGELDRAPAVSRSGGLGAGGGAAGSLFPRKRLLTLYGAPQLTGTILGKLSPAAAARKAVKQARPYARKGDRRVIPGFDLIAVVANSTPGPDGKYRTRQPDKLIRAYLREARAIGGRLVLDIQPGRAKVSDEIDALSKWIDEPDVDVSIDPEWEVGPRGVPGRTQGSIKAKEINRVSRRLQRIVDVGDLPPKALVIHQFHDGSVRKPRDVVQRDGVDVTLNFDGIGSPAAKVAGYQSLSRRGLFNGFSIFYSLDTKVMSPRSVLALDPEADFLLFQ